MCKMHACNPVATVSVNKLSLFLLEKLGQWCLLCARAFWRRLLRRLLLSTSTTTATLGSGENEKKQGPNAGNSHVAISSTDYWSQQVTAIGDLGTSDLRSNMLSNNITQYTDFFCISQGKVATSDRWGGQICKVFVSHFLRIQHTKNY